jgi:hypothetical protein
MNNTLNYIPLGSTPNCEFSTTISDPNYYLKTKAQCFRLINLIRYINGIEPKGALLHTKIFKQNNYFFLEVVCYYDPNKNETKKYALSCKQNFPDYWQTYPKVS